MGLAIEVGILANLNDRDEDYTTWLRETFQKVNEVLAEEGVRSHDEPERLPLIHSRARETGYPYSFLHYLRRVYARAQNDPDWIATPIPEGEDPCQDPVLEEETFIMYSHLLCHSDCDGFYLPIEFDDIIVDRKNLKRVAGGILGSSYKLREELVWIAPKLGIVLEGERLSDSEAERINKESETEVGMWRELIVWLSLFEAARLSIEYKTAICFT